MLEAEDFDDPSTEPKEYLPKFTIGDYALTSDGAEYKDYSDSLVLEFTIDSATGADALATGTRAAVVLPSTYTKKNKMYVLKRLKSPIYALLNRRNIEGKELVGIIKDPVSMIGKKAKLSVRAELDDEGNPNLRDDGTPWLTFSWTAA